MKRTSLMSFLTLLMVAALALSACAPVAPGAAPAADDGAMADDDMMGPRLRRRCACRSRRDQHDGLVFPHHRFLRGRVGTL